MDCGLAVGFAAVTYAHHPDFVRPVVYLVDNAAIADPDAPVVVRTGELAAAMRARVVDQRPKRAYHTRENCGVKSPQAALSGGFEEDGVHGESTAARRVR
jgi:hypothetical protein